MMSIRVPFPTRRAAWTAALGAALALGACGGSDDDPDGAPVDGADGGADGGAGGGEAPGLGQLPTPTAPVDALDVAGPGDEVPEPIAAQAGDAALRMVFDGACGSAGEEMSARLYLDTVDGPDGPDGQGDGGAGDEGIGTNVTAFASFEQGLGSSIELLSRTDDAIRFRIVEPDVVALTATVEGLTLTQYLGAWPAGEPAASALRKPTPAGCLWSLRLPPVGGGSSFCGSAYSFGGAGELGQDERRLDVAGCETENAVGLPIVELEPIEVDGPR